MIVGISQYAYFSGDIKKLIWNPERFFLGDIRIFVTITKKTHQYFLNNFYRLKTPILKIYYAKWTLRIEVVNGKKNIC
jgi:hypothetical protein